MDIGSRWNREASREARLNRYKMLLQSGGYLETAPNREKVYKVATRRLVWTSQDGALHRETLTRSDLRWLISALNLKRVDQVDGTTRFVVR